jgi:crotonobetaine/carnitine-CoA ligase
MNIPERPSTLAMLTSVLAEQAQRSGNDVCLIEAESGRQVTYRELHEESRRLSGSLRALGVAAGDAVATMLPHSIDTYRIWFGLAQLGALEVPIGTRYRGRMLEHIIRDSGASVLIIDGRYAGELKRVLDDSDLRHVRTVLLPDLQSGQVGETPTAVTSLRDPGPHDLALVLYTSGTTGPSKGVLVPWGQVHATVTGVFPEGTCVPGKVLYGPFPPNHIGGRLFAGMGIQYGIPAVIRDAFSASGFWVDVARYGCTTTALVSAMASILMSPPAREDDADNPLQDVLMTPLIAEYKTFESRFGVRACTDYNMTETSIPTHSGWDIDDWRSCGRVRQGAPGYQLRVVDEHDFPVRSGEVGEMVCRTDQPWAMNAGYLGRPVETATAWRNGWFHTGDAFRVDEEGRCYFVDRIKDAIRRRGENVSSFEIEREVLDHPEVLECAAIGVPSELGEQDIKVFVVRRPGSGLTEATLIDHLRAHCADFMVPRYVEFLDSLPRTEATRKVKKADLRAREAGRGQVTQPTHERSAGPTPMEDR